MTVSEQLEALKNSFDEAISDAQLLTAHARYEWAFERVNEAQSLLAAMRVLQGKRRRELGFPIRRAT